MTVVTVVTKNPKSGDGVTEVTSIRNPKSEIRNPKSHEVVLEKIQVHDYHPAPPISQLLTSNF
jgi:hypothetical protein